MKRIFKLYIFKLTILSLTMIFISFGASAYPIKKMYQYCKPYQNNGFQVKSMDAKGKINALTCVSYKTAIKDLGFYNCTLLNQAKGMGADDQTGPFDTFEMVKQTMASGKAGINAVIASFNKFAENNPDKWKYKSAHFFKEFLSDVFPCKLDK